MPEARDEVLEIAVKVCEWLFGEYGVPVTHVAERQKSAGSMLYCGVLGFSGDQMRGSAVLAASKSTLDDSNPVKGGSARDWIAELVNQLVGRLKLRLLPHKVEIYLATPVVLRGEQLSLEARGPVVPMWFQRPSGDTLGLWLDLDLAKGFALADPIAEESPPEEGSMMLL